tara:strand:- start:715 stop:936 length:222 start_codon:yes stop_codon:yes gene_type:complete
MSDVISKLILIAQDNVDRQVRFMNKLGEAAQVAEELGLDHSVILLLDSMIDDFSKERLDFHVNNFSFIEVEEE